MTDAIGGYFELELRKGEHYQRMLCDSILLETALSIFFVLVSIQKFIFPIILEM